MYLDIIPATNLPLNRPQIYTYGLPNNLAGRVSVGQIVEAPLYFRKVTGVVLGERKGLGKNSKNFKIKNIFNIVDYPPFTKEQLKLARWLSDYYHVSLGLVIKSMLPPLTKKKPEEPPAYTDILKKYNLTLPHSLENSETAEKIIKSSQKQFFLFSKNRKDIYGNLTGHYVKQKKQVLILVPEISDVLFMAYFIEHAISQAKVAVLTSDLTKNQHAGHWLNIHSGSANVIIGTRMAVFAPVKNLGLIIMDDEHDSSFKQWDMNPRYHAREAARKLAELHGARLVLGTTTPSVESYYLAKKQSLPAAPSGPPSPRARAEGSPSGRGRDKESNGTI